MNVISNTVRTKASPQALWKLWSDVNTWPQWDEAIEEISLPGPFVVGSSGRLKPRGGPAARFTLTKADPVLGFSDVSDMGIFKMTFDHTWKQISETEIEFTHQVRFHGLLGGVFFKKLGGHFRKDLPTAMEKLARQAEGKSA